MKTLIKLLFLLLIAPAAYAQTQVVESVNIIRRGYWQVVSPDTITNHTSQDQANERQLNLLLQGVPESQISIKPPLYDLEATYKTIYPDTVYMPGDTVYSSPEIDTVYAYEERTLYAVMAPDSMAVYYDEHPAVRNINWQVIEDSLDADNFRVRIHGTTPANEVRFASKCIGYDSTMTAIINSRSMTLTPDSTGFVDNTTTDYTCHPVGGNASMNYWLTASTDTEEIQVHKYIDIAHIRSLGN